MQYILQDLLRVRIFRQNIAERALIKAQSDLHAAQNFLKEKQKELDDYKIWCKKEEERLFQSVIGKKVKNNVVVDFRIEINTARDGELAYAKRVIDAENNLREAEAKVSAARNHYHISFRNCQKIEEHKKLWLKEAEKEVARLQDIEMEEFKSHLEKEEEEEYEYVD